MKMREIKIARIISVSNQLEKHVAANLLPGEIDKRRNWLCEKGTPKGVVILELECRTVITTINIGNANSAFIEILVGNLGDSIDKYQHLLRAFSLMNYNDSISGKNTGQVKFFYQKDFCKNVAYKEWQVIQLVCSQPYNKSLPFGLCFIRVTGLDDLVTVQEDKEQKSALEPHIRRDEPEKRVPTILEEMLKSVTTTRIKVASIRTRSSLSEDKREQNLSYDFPDNRGNKYIELERSAPQKNNMEEEREGSSSSAREIRERVMKGAERTRKRQRKRDNRACGRHFSRLMEDVFFTISGFKNPERSDIRNQAIKMGAKYSSDWNSLCTHLICSYKNTPKYNEVKGKGKIVTKDWIQESYKDKKRYPWRRFALDANEKMIEESEEEILAKEDDADTSDEDENVSQRAGPSTMRVSEKKKRTKDPYLTDTDEEGPVLDTTDHPMPHLPDIFKDKIFHVDQSLDNCQLIEKYITAYNGSVTCEIYSEVDYYITETGGTPLMILRNKAPKMKAVRPAWIWAVNSASKWISPWKFMLSV